MRPGTKALLFALVFAAAAPAARAEGGAGDKGPGESLGAEVDKAIDEAVKRFERLIDRLPIYEAPEVTPEGDVIIRKRRPNPPPLPEGQRRA